MRSGRTPEQPTQLDVKGASYFVATTPSFLSRAV